MKKKLCLLWALVACFIVSCTTSPTTTPAIPADEEIESKVESLLKKMTLDEKIGQMCQLTIDLLKDYRANPAQGFTLSEAMLDTVIGKYKVGSILNVPNGIAQNTAKWQEIITRIQEKSIEELGIPCLYGVDQIHGATSKYLLKKLYCIAPSNICLT